MRVDRGGDDVARASGGLTKPLAVLFPQRGADGLNSVRRM